MKNHDILLVYYSKTGTTRRVARVIAGALPCDTEEVVETERFNGVVGYVRAVYQAMIGSAPGIKPMGKDPSQYRLVIIGTPVWMGKISSPMRTYLIKKGHQFKSVAFFVTYHGMGRNQVLQQLSGLCATPPLTQLCLKTSEVTNGFEFEKIKIFTDLLRSSQNDEIEKVA